MEEFTEQVAKYKFTEDFADIIKSTEFSTNDLTDVFSHTMGFLRYCGITKDNLYEMFDLYKEDYI